MADKIEVKIDVEGYNETVVYRDLWLNQAVLGHHTFGFIWNVGSFKADGDFQLKVAKDYIGKAVSISFNNNLFNGVITKVTIDERNSNSHAFIIEGNSPTILLEDNLRSASYYKKNLSHVVNKVLSNIASNLLNKKVQPENSDELYYTVQYNETDFEFLCRLAKQYGEWFYYDGEKLVFGSTEDAGVELKNGVDLDEFSVEVRLRPLKFNYSGYDPFTGETITGNLDNLSGSGNHYQQLAADTSNELFSRQDSRSHHINHLHNKKLLDKAKEVEKDGAIAQMVYFNGISKNPLIKPGNKIKVSGSDGSGDEYYVVSVNHHSNLFGNYENSIKAVPSSVKKPPYTNAHVFPLTEAQSAVVKENNDSDGLGRVKVQFCWQGSNDMTPWIRITSPSGGGGKGMHFIPEKGEEVLVAFEGGNAEKPYVIGTVYNGKAKINFANAENDLKVIQTRSGHVIELNDKNGAESITVKDKNNNIITIDTPGSKITIKDKNSNQIVIDSAADSIDVTANESINMKASNINMVASGAITMSAGAAITMNAGAAIEGAAGTMVTFGAGVSTSLISAKDTVILAGKMLSASGGKNVKLGSGAGANMELLAKGEATLKSSKKMDISSKESTITGSDTATFKSNKATVEGSSKAVVKGSQVDIS